MSLQKLKQRALTNPEMSREKGSNKKEEHENIKHLMEHPVLVGHDANAKIIRAQLFSIAVATIFIISFDIKIAEGSSVFGIKLQNLTTDHILWLALILLIYQSFHFLWASLDGVQEWLIRQTALDTGGWGGGGIKILSENETEKVRQTTIYSYLVFTLEVSLRDIISVLNKSKSEDVTKDDIDRVNQALNNIKSNLKEERISDAFYRFDHAFKMFYKSQNMRWLLLEFLLPLSLGFVAIGLIIVRFFFSK